VFITVSNSFLYIYSNRADFSPIADLSKRFLTTGLGMCSYVTQSPKLRFLRIQWFIDVTGCLKAKENVSLRTDSIKTYISYISNTCLVLLGRSIFIIIFFIVSHCGVSRGKERG